MAMLTAERKEVPAHDRRRDRSERGRTWRVWLLVLLLAATAGFVWVQRPRPAEPWTGDHRIGAERVPQVYYEGQGWRDNPTIVAQEGVIASSRGDWPTAQIHADWLLAHQEPDGAWRHPFEFTGHPGFPSLRPGFASVMGQGQSLTLLARLYERDPQQRYLAAMRSAVAFLNRPVRDGGVRTTLAGQVWWELYPTDPASYVLNGFVFGLLGLHDAARWVPEAARMYEQGRATLDANLWRWDVNGKPAYDLTHRDGSTPRFDIHYDWVHAELLWKLLTVDPSPKLDEWVERWYPRQPTLTPLGY